MKIGRFERTEQGFKGRIITLECQSEKVEIRSKKEEGAYDVLINGADVGYAKVSGVDRDVIVVQIDDPSFDAPIEAQLRPDGIWFALERKRS
ncbi:DUF736 family protein [Rhizobium laguerreae]|uniref:DUF736 family protein n=1 Tax=Rhizobium laguerreae TaxID=1076926 RepID=UPI001C91EF97|nr:DUF736 family protein [Rhizobium laguerreae]MBY3495637.1 DUF736 domain-containing protein [Rhizobium laguerreae]